MLTDGQVVDRYVVEHLLGAGGMATVYRVRHRTLGTLHALKVLSLTGPRMVDRFVQEGQVQARLRHPNVVAVTDVFDVGGAPGLLMEFIAGPSLDRRLVQSPIPLDAVERIFRGVLTGVGVAHAEGVIHRDLKPANVLLDGEVAKVADFGLAKVFADLMANDHHTRSGTAMGTPAYMAPEQVRDARSVDARADMWSLGCILYELLTARRPFDGPDMYAIFNAVVNGNFVPVERARPDLPRRWGVLVRACLETDRDRRIPDTAALASLFDDADPAWGSRTLTPHGATMMSLPPYLGEPPDARPPRVPRPAAAPTLGPSSWPSTVPPAPARGRRWALGVVGVGAVLAAAGAAWWVSGSASGGAPLSEAPLVAAAIRASDPDAPQAPAIAPVPSEASASSAPAIARAIEAAPRPAPASRVVPPVDAAAVPDAAPIGTGTLKVNSIPWSSVTLDGVAQSDGAWSGEVAAGSHRVLLRTADGATHTQVVSVVAGGVSSVCWNFELDARCLD